MNCDPYNDDSYLNKFFFRKTPELSTTLSAPDLRYFFAVDRFLIYPPTDRGIKHLSDNLLTNLIKCLR